MCKATSPQNIEAYTSKYISVNTTLQKLNYMLNYAPACRRVIALENIATELLNQI